MKFRLEDFRAALEEARRVVKAMPPAEVPHSLRRTRSSSSRKLTPPEARALYRELDRDEGFRRAILDGWEAARSPSADRRTAASVLFLERSEGWESQAQGFLTEIELNEALMEIQRLEGRLEEAQSDVEYHKNQMIDTRRQVEDDSRQRTDQLRQDLGRARVRIGELENQLSEEGKNSEYWEGEVNAAFDELTLADVRVEELRKLVGKERSTHVSCSAKGNGWWGGGLSRDPVKAARMLDQMVSFWEVGSGFVPEPIASSPRLELPPGMDPKSGQAVRWVYDDAPRLTLVVDGWNAAYNWNYHRNISEPPDQGTIRFITNKLNKLAAYSVGRHWVWFYLDSRKMAGLEEGWDSRFKDGRLVGQYVEYADDAIADDAAERRGEPVVVITSDKELADRCRANGAVVLAAEALTEWMSDSPV